MSDVWLYYDNSGDKNENPIEKYNEGRKYLFFPFDPKRVSKGYAMSLMKQYGARFRTIPDGDYDAFLEEHAQASGVPRRVLLRRREGVGDVILTTPAVHALRKTGALIDYATNPDYFCVLECNPDIDRLIPHDIPENGIYADKIDWNYHSEHSENRDKLHRSDIYTEMTKIPLVKGEESPVLKLSQDTLDQGRKLLERRNGLVYVGLQPFSTHMCRDWSLDHCQRLAELLKTQHPNVRLVLMAKQLVKMTGSNVINLSSRTTMRQGCGVVAQLDLMTGCDSGLYHVAGSLGIPIVTIFGIITGDLRTRYYRGYKRDVHGDCQADRLGCGDWHMERCHVETKGNIKGVAKCMENYTAGMMLGEIERFLQVGIKKVSVEPSPLTMSQENPGKSTAVPVTKSVRPYGLKSLTLTLIVRNEAQWLPHLISNCFDHPSIKRVVAIDGGSTDGTVDILKKARAEVYVHPWRDDYHDMVACQRNIMASYVPEGDRYLFMDADELMSQELRERLPELIANPQEFIQLPRRTFRSLQGAQAYFKTGDTSDQHLNYPDYQPRMYTASRFHKYFRSPHHLTLNAGEPWTAPEGWDILHYGKPDTRKMPSLNGQWVDMVDRGKALGLKRWYEDQSINRGGSKTVYTVEYGLDLGEGQRHRLNMVKDLGPQKFRRWEKEFTVFEPFISGRGVDLGCGTDRLSETVLSVDQQSDNRYAHADIVQNVQKLPIFSSGSMDFVFSSHCLEDFDPKEIPEIFGEWLRILRPGGYLCLVLPDMEGGRYPKAGDPQGNPSHRANVGKHYMAKIAQRYPVKLIQCDTIPHQYCSVDFVYQKGEK